MVKIPIPCKSHLHPHTSHRKHPIRLQNPCRDTGTSHMLLYLVLSRDRFIRPDECIPSFQFRKSRFHLEKLISKRSENELAELLKVVALTIIVLKEVYCFFCAQIGLPELRILYLDRGNRYQVSRCLLYSQEACLRAFLGSPHH